MREALAILNGARITVQATVVRRSTRPGWTGTKQPTILLAEVRSLDGALLADHLWLLVGRRLAALDPQPGDVVQLDGRVQSYLHRHSRGSGAIMPDSEDYNLYYMSNCRLLFRAAQEPVPTPEQVSTPAPRLLATILALWHQEGQPPSLARVCQQSGLRPWQALKQAHELAHSGAIRFEPDGHVFLSRTQEVYAS
jgi:hypothetical protein